MAEKPIDKPLKEDPLDNVPGQVDDDNDEEAVLKEHCKYFNKFIHQLKTRGTKGLSRDSLKAIKDMKLNMTSFLDDPETLKEEAPEIVTNTKTGAITKNSKKKTKQDRKEVKQLSSESDITEKDESEDNSSTCSPNGTISGNSNNSSESNSDSSSNKRKSKKKKKTSRKKRDNLAEMLRKLDNRQVPKQEKFNEDDGQDLKKYLEKFDRYCIDNFKGDKDFWIGELERHLCGKTLENFKALKCYGDSYEVVKKKLISWYKDEKELRKNKYREKFKRAKPKSGETLFMFSNRLEGLFKLAYSKLNVETSNTLMAQFQASVSKRNRELIRTQIIAYKIKDKKMKWTALKKWARVVDVEREKEKQEGSTSSDIETVKPKEIIINLSKIKKGKDSKSKQIIDDDETDTNNQINYSNQVVTTTANQNEIRNQQKKFSQNVQKTNQYNYQPQKQTNQINPYQNNEVKKFFPNSYSQIKVCNICNRFGHIPKYCRLRLNTCFICGNENHFMRNCPKYYKNTNQFNRDNRDQQHQSNQYYRNNNAYQNQSNQYNRDNNAYQNRQRNYFQNQRSFSSNREMRGESPPGRRSYSDDEYRGRKSNYDRKFNENRQDNHNNNYNQTQQYQRNQNRNNTTDQQERQDSYNNNNPEQKNLNSRTLI